MHVGVNYPWRHYGGDFGPTVWGTSDGIGANRDEVARDFAVMAELGVEVVRWFVFTDGRGGLAVDREGWPAGVLDEAVDDLDTLCRLALDAGLTVVPVLFDHPIGFAPTEVNGARIFGRAHWLADPHGQARLVDTVIAPLAARYGTRGPEARLGRAIAAWDLLNEPDWIVREHHPSPRVPYPVAFDVLATWVERAIASIRAHDAGRITIGTARLRFVSWWDDPRFDFDFLQAHTYYDPDYDFDVVATPCTTLSRRRPVIIGECSARGDLADEARARPALSVVDLAAATSALGYAGTWPWSWRGVDSHGPLAHDDVRRLAANARARRNRVG